MWDLDSGEPKEACIRWGVHWRQLLNTIEPSVCSGNAACCRITLVMMSHLFVSVAELCLALCVTDFLYVCLYVCLPAAHWYCVRRRSAVEERPRDMLCQLK